jgi:hypothetical protein
MALRDQQGTLREKFNRVGGWETFVRTETETGDAGSFGQHRPGGLVSKFTNMAVASVPVPVENGPAMGRKKPLDVNAGRSRCND